MRRRLRTSRVTVRPEYLPDSRETTELNYHTCMSTPHQDAITTLRLAAIATTQFLAAAFVIRFVGFIPYYYIASILTLFVFWYLYGALVAFRIGEPVTPTIAVGLYLTALAGIAKLLAVSTTAQAAYLFVFGTGLVVTLVVSHYVTVEACSWMAVNERIRRTPMRRWQHYLRYLLTGKTPVRCPEIGSYPTGFLGVAVAFGIGFLAVRTFERYDTPWIAENALLLAIAAFVLCLVILWNVWGFLEILPNAQPLAAFVVTWKAITTFLCYNLHNVDAAGLYRFKRPFLRSPSNRIRLFAFPLVVFATAGVCGTLNVLDLSAIHITQKNAAHREVPRLAHDEGGEAWKVTRADLEFAKRFPSQEERRKYLQRKEKSYERKISLSDIFSVLLDWPIQVGFSIARSIAIVVIAPFVLVYSVLWFVGGRVLLAYFQALEAPHAYKVPRPNTEADITLKKKRDFTPWDNRIERITFSKNALEREHFYLGAAVEGDYPILLHESLLYKHAHLLGDTGSGKTSLGVTPLLTQIIAKGEHSVLIMDLKGDPSLFHAAREEAALAGLPFRWFTNRTEDSSFVFNPFAQSHVPRLTTNQLTEGIMQALSLDYGDDYGRAYFSALNGVVLGGYMKQYRKQIDSFKTLYKYASDKNAFRSIGTGNDWDKTRHLTAVLGRLGLVTPLNVVRADVPDKPGVIDEQIDLPSLLRSPQVVYFNLSSALEPTTVAPLARLAIFTLLSAAALRRQEDGNRVFVFIDEFQRVISNNLRIVLEQARSMRLHFILANQTLGQMKQEGTDATDVVESCTAFKQSFRASDEASIKRLMASSGEGLFHSLQWDQLLIGNIGSEDTYSLDMAVNDRFAEVPIVKVSESAGPLLELNTVLDVSSLPLGSFVRFTEGSGFTQHSSFTTAMFSEYHITQALHGIRSDAPWPPVDELTVAVELDEDEPPPTPRFMENVAIPKPTDVPASFDADLEQRLVNEGQRVRTGPTHPKKGKPR